MPDPVVAARRQLHAIAENLIAGPQYRAAGTIRLAVRPDGFTGTTLPVAVRGTTLVWPEGEVRLAGSAGAIADAAGLQMGPPPGDVYPAAAPLEPESTIDLDPASADLVYRSLYAGGIAVAMVLEHGHPVLWPEHFDVGADENGVNYGVSAGDDHHPLPYAYVGPWDYPARPRTGVIWNAPFGALHPLHLGADEHALTAEIADFFGRAQSAL